MRPETSRLPTTIVQIVDKQPLDTMNRKTLHVLQQAAGDKENLVGSGRSVGLRPTNKDGLQTVKDVIDEKKNLIREHLNQKSLGHVSKRQKKMPNIVKGKSKVSADELTSTGQPSEKYWSILAEKRRVALETALAENEILHEKIKLLEEENATTKQLLSETTEVIELLQSMVSENDTSDDSVDMSNTSVDITLDSVDTSNDSINESFD